MIFRVNDVEIDTYETFMFVIPTAPRPVSIFFRRQIAPVSRLVAEQSGSSNTLKSVSKTPGKNLKVSYLILVELYSIYLL
jgi:hypothetical protein